LIRLVAGTLLNKCSTLLGTGMVAGSPVFSIDYNLQLTYTNKRDEFGLQEVVKVDCPLSPPDYVNSQEFSIKANI